MPQPQWITPAGSLGTISEGVFYQVRVEATAGADPVLYRLIAGELPAGIQVTDSGSIEGVPRTEQLVQGVPEEVARDVTSRFAIRAFTQRLVNGVLVLDRLNDRTFTLTITGQDLPQFVTPPGLIGTYYDSSEVDITIEFTDQDLDEEIEVLLAAGQLPPGLALSPRGVISGVITPLVGPPNTALPGEDTTPWDFYPWDFRTRATSQNFQFIVEITDGKQSNLRTFEIFVYAKDDMTADTTNFTADNTFITADVTPLRTPVLLTPQGSIGVTRSDNFFAFKFDGVDFDGDDFRYFLTLGPGLGYDETGFDADGSFWDQGSFGLPSGALGLTLNSVTGWLSGYIPDQGAIEETYRFAVQVYKNNLPQYISPYNFYTLTVTTDIDQEVTWITNSDLGDISNGAVSLLTLLARPSADVDLLYRIVNGSDSRLPQGLTLLSSGNISGRVSFNTFALDGGTTFFDRGADAGTDVLGTTFDSVYEFTVNAFAPSTETVFYRVGGITVTNGGSGYTPSQLSAITVTAGGDLYDPMDPPTVTIAPPPNIFGNRPAVAGAVTISSGAITTIAIADPGFGYTSPPLITITSTSGVGAQAEAEIYTITVTLGAPPATEGAIQATAGSVTVVNGIITNIAIGNPGAGYLTAPSVTITGGGGNGATASTSLRENTVDYSVSVFRRFSLRVVRQFNEPYETLYMRAMPGFADRALINQFLNDDDLIPQASLYRADDPNFGRAQDIIYDHAYGLAAAALDDYAEAMEINHYWRNITLGPITTAQARDQSGAVIYEVIYSPIQDNLLNNQGQSVGKSVTLPYPVLERGELTQTVYPNSLPNMRDQIIDEIGQVSPALPLWMLSRQANRQVLGFVPAWVIAYVKPGQADRLVYNINQNLDFSLNDIDFQLDRYILDRSQTKLWNSATDQWIPSPPQSTSFDKNSAFDAFIPVLNITGRVQALSTQYGFGSDTVFTVQPSSLGTFVVLQINGITQQYFTENSQNWIGDGSTTEFLFSNVNVLAQSTQVTIDGVVQIATADYVLSGNVLQFTTAPAANAVIAIQQISGSFYLTYSFDEITVNLFSAPPSTTTTYTADGSTTDFSYSPITGRGLFVYVDQVLQVLDVDYVLETSPSRVVFTTAPDSGEPVSIVQPSTVSIYQVIDRYLMSATSNYRTATVFDLDSTTFNVPADSWSPSDAFDKYLLYPRRTILG